MTETARPDLDERFTLHPMEGEEVLTELLAEGERAEDCDDDAEEGEEG